MAVIRGLIKVKAPSRQQVSNVYKDFAKQVKALAKDIDSASDVSVFNRRLEAHYGNITFIYDADHSHWDWHKDGRATRTIAVEVHIFTARGHQGVKIRKVGTIELLKVTFFANGIQDDLEGVPEVQDIVTLIENGA